MCLRWKSQKHLECVCVGQVSRKELWHPCLPVAPSIPRFLGTTWLNGYEEVHQRKTRTSTSAGRDNAKAPALKKDLADLGKNKDEELYHDVSLVLLSIKLLKNILRAMGHSTMSRMPSLEQPVGRTALAQPSRWYLLRWDCDWLLQVRILSHLWGLFHSYPSDNQAPTGCISLMKSWQLVLAPWSTLVRSILGSCLHSERKRALLFTRWKWEEEAGPHYYVFTFCAWGVLPSKSCRETNQSQLSVGLSFW